VGVTANALHPPSVPDESNQPLSHP
jgi:hypothetical protein